MKINKVLSIAIAFAMLAMSFVVVSNARAQQTTDSDNTTQIRVNAAYPKLYTLGIYEDAAGTIDVTDTQIDPLAMDYYIVFEYNYSLGSANCDFLIRGWHDGGAAPSSYPAAPGDSERNLAFEILCDFSMVTTVNFPGGDLEIVSNDGAAPLDVSTTEPVGQERYQVAVPITFGAQVRAAEYGGVAPSGAHHSIAPQNTPDTTALNNPYTWDFSVSVRDSVQTSAAVIGCAEFGIYRMVSLSVAGNPTGNAPPGGSTVMAPHSAITYSSNTAYFVNVTLTGDLLLNGVGPANIPTTSIYVQNMHSEAVYNVNSYIAGSPTRLAAANVNLYVWGANNTALPNDDIYILASNHGTTSAGPATSDYTGAGETTTELQWSVDVPGATPEGFYWATILITIDGDIGLTL